jgi:hypothetical protein
MAVHQDPSVFEPPQHDQKPFLCSANAPLASGPCHFVGRRPPLEKTLA